MKPALIVAGAIGLMVIAASSAESTELGDLPLNAMVTDGIVQIGKHKYPLPPGEWRLIAKNESIVTVNSFPTGARILRGYLINTKEKQYRAGILISGSDGSTRVSSWTSDSCARDDVVFKDAFDGNFKFPECLIVNHYVNLLQPTKGWLNDAATFVEINQIVMPQTALAAMYDRYLYGDFVTVRFWINPEFAEQAPSKAIDWIANDWHKDRVIRDSAKSLYLEKFVAWAKQIPAAYRSALESEKPSALLSEFPDLKQ